MFNVGGGEMFAIFLLALLILGPERLPKAMGEVGRWVAQLRRMSSGFQDEIRRAMDPDDAPFRPGEERIYPKAAPEPPPEIDEVKVVHAIDATASAPAEVVDGADDVDGEAVADGAEAAVDAGAADDVVDEADEPPRTGTDGPPR